MADFLNSNSPQLSQRDKVALERELRKLTDEANLTFQPNLISGRSKRESSSTTGASRFESLYKDAVERFESIYDPKSKGGVDERGLTFKPEITRRGRSKSAERNGTNLVDNLYNAPGAGRPKTPERSDSSNGDLFKPKISKRASSLDRGDAAVQERLHAAGQRAKEKVEKKKEAIQQKAEKECTFTPRMSTKSRSRSGSLTNGSDHSNSSDANANANATMIERMAKFQKEKQKKLEEAKKLVDQEKLAQATFKPQLVASRRNSGSWKESDPNVYQRLAKQTQKDLSGAVQAALSELTFKPQVNKTPPAIAATRRESGKDVHERLFDAALERKRAKEEEVILYLFK
jgi:hypothetical protein